MGDSPTMNNSWIELLKEYILCWILKNEPGYSSLQIRHYEQDGQVNFVLFGFQRSLEVCQTIITVLDHEAKTLSTKKLLVALSIRASDAILDLQNQGFGVVNVHTAPYEISKECTEVTGA